MNSAQHFRTNARISVIYLILFVSLGTYSLFTKPDRTTHEVQKTLSATQQKADGLTPGSN